LVFVLLNYRVLDSWFNLPLEFSLFSLSVFRIPHRSDISLISWVHDFPLYQLQEVFMLCSYNTQHPSSLTLSLPYWPTPLPLLVLCETFLSLFRTLPVRFVVWSSFPPSLPVLLLSRYFPVPPAGPDFSLSSCL